jgi:hypothetical protein
MGRMQGLCSCGHAAAAHEHYRRGSDCALCSPGGCVKFRSVGKVASLRDAAPAADPPLRTTTAGVHGGSSVST